MGEFFFAISIIAMVIFMIYTGVTSISEEVEFKKTNKKTANLKFDSFINAIKRNYSAAIQYELSASNCIYKLPITNGVENIGHFLISVWDRTSEKTNSVGSYKIHKYQISVDCLFKNQVRLKEYSDFLDELPETSCQQIIMELKTRIESKIKFKDSIQIYSIQ